MTFVDRSLSRGLADRYLSEIQERENKYVAAREALLMSSMGKRADVRRVTSAVIEAGQQSTFTQVYANHPKWRWASISVFAPTLMTLPEMGVQNRILSFSLLRTILHAGRRADLTVPFRPILLLTEHAIERLFQRMNVISSESVEDEIHEAMFMYVPVISACHQFGFEQIVLPTKSGMFLGECSHMYSAIYAKSWVPTSPDKSRNSDAAHTIARLYDAIGGKVGVAEYLAGLPSAGDHAHMPLPGECVEPLQRLTWLKEEYVPRDDPVGELWMRANAQASQSS